MSLDVYLEVDTGGEENVIVYSRNITHNLGEMAGEAGIYKCLWRPDEIGIKTASELIKLLEGGLNTLKADPRYFKTFNPENGWGTYEGLVEFVEDYLNNCKQNPKCVVSVSR